MLCTRTDRAAYSMANFRNGFKEEMSPKNNGMGFLVISPGDGSRRVKANNNNSILHKELD